ncbi:MAG: ABC transporter permease subunit [Chloroflexota bacterium]
MKRAWIILRKEWAEVFKNRFVVFTVAFLPLILTALPLGILYAAGSAGDLGGMTEDMPASFSQVCDGLEGDDCTRYFFVSQFLLLFMLMPLAIPVTIASYSIIGEKTRRTLEPVLATPITTVELLTGKALSAVVPAVIATWVAFGIFLLGSALLSVGPAVMSRLTEPLWLMAVLLVGPLLALAAVSVAMMVSSRANDPRVAEQLSMLVILPLLALFFGQIAGLILVNERLILWMAFALVLIDAGLIAFAVQLFQRETILTRWK